MEPNQIVAVIDKLFMYIPIYVFAWCFLSLMMAGFYKYQNPDKRYPEFVAMAYGGFAVLIFWMITVIKL